MINKFEDLIVWQKARLLARNISSITNNPKFARDFNLRDQILSSSRSIMSNIAEGFGRFTSKDYKQFLTIARGSLAETQSHLYVALDDEYISQTEFQDLMNLSAEVYRLINGLITHLNRNLKQLKP